MPSLKDLYNLPSYGAQPDATGYVYEPKQLDNPQNYSYEVPRQTSSLRRLADFRKQDIQDSVNYQRQQESAKSNQGFKNLAEGALNVMSPSYYAKLLGVPAELADAADYLPVGAGEGKMLAIGMFGRKARKEAKEAEKWAKFDEIPGAPAPKAKGSDEEFELRPFNAEEAAAKRKAREELERVEAIKRGRHSADSLANLIREPSEYGPFQASMYEPFELRPYNGPKPRQGADRKWQLDSLWSEMAADPNKTPQGMWGTPRFKAAEEDVKKYRNNPSYKEAYLRDWEIQQKLKDLGLE